MGNRGLGRLCHGFFRGGHFLPGFRGGRGCFRCRGHGRKLRLFLRRGSLQRQPQTQIGLVIFRPGVGIRLRHGDGLVRPGIHQIAGNVPGRHIRRPQQHRRRRGKVDAVAPLSLPEEPQGKILHPLAHPAGIQIIHRRVRHQSGDDIRLFRIGGRFRKQPRQYGLGFLPGLRGQGAVFLPVRRCGSGLTGSLPPVVRQQHPFHGIGLGFLRIFRRAAGEGHRLRMIGQVPIGLPALRPDGDGFRGRSGTGKGFGALRIGIPPQAVIFIIILLP